MPRPMRKQFDNNMKGVLFDNADRKRNDSDPDMKGSVEVEGVEYWVAGWWNQHAVKGDYLKLSFTPKESDDRSPQERNNSYNRGEDRGARGPQHGGNRGGNVQRGRPTDSGGGYGRNNGPDDGLDDDIPF